jgi:prefoldin subunit 5
VSTLEAENQQLKEENQQLRDALKAKDERIDKLEARLRQSENPHTPPGK